MNATDANRTRWQTEAAFFDAEAAGTTEAIGHIDPLAVARYSAPRLRKRFNKEFRFHLAGNLEGKSVLDVGCGYGGNVVLLAKLGAKVTGIDISAKSIELAQRRAELDGVADSVRLICSPLETAEIGDQSFDLIWGDGILHHLIANLDSVMSRLAQLTKPGGLLMFSEPVNLNHTLRRIRRSLPIHTDATPDERPLERQEIEILRRHVPDLKMRFFDLFGRLNRFILVQQNYERSPVPRRSLSGALAAVDWALLGLPGVRSMAGQAVLWGTPGSR